MNYNNQSKFNINLLIFISVTTIFIIIYLIQKNNYLEQLRANNSLNKESFYYNTQITSQKGSVTGLKRADRIRDIASRKLNMVIAEPESLIVIIDE